MQLPVEISCAEVQQLRDSGGDFLLLDCREPVEHRFAAISDAQMLPMSQLVQRVGELASSRDRHIVVMCHHGVRSLQTTLWLREQGFASVQSMQGGIDSWAREVDPAVPRY